MWLSLKHRLPSHEFLPPWISSVLLLLKSVPVSLPFLAPRLPKAANLLSELFFQWLSRRLER
jgi:hypothetical protein